MHIGFRTSGGRGEYELVGSHAGQSAASLEGWTFLFRWPDGIVRDTLLRLEPGDSGKPRLRSSATPPFQIGRLMAAALLLPLPRRELRKAGFGLPVLQANLYVLSKVRFDPSIELNFTAQAVIAEPSYIEIANATHTDFIDVTHRWARITEVCQRESQFAGPVASALSRYTASIQSGAPIDGQLATYAKELREALANTHPRYDKDGDPLPALEVAAGIPNVEEPALPPPDQLDEEDHELKVRSASTYRLARARGFSARQFSLAVREAYGERCAFCGARLGGIPGVPSGIDAAHILAWSSYDLDTINNGLALCKTHHWAFDAALMVPILDQGTYVVRFTRLAEHFGSATLRILGADGFKIPADWLPVEESERPNPIYLARLYEDVAISF